jgi:hypothetical protein
LTKVVNIPLTFLLAQLHLYSLIDKTKPKAIGSTIERLLKRSEAYNHAYDKVIKRIKGQKPGFEELGKKILLWITCTKRHISTLDL